MDINTFMDNTNHDNIVHNMRHFFDENMAMYNIINNYKMGVGISANADSTSIVYTVFLDSDCDADTVMNVLTNTTVSVYGNQYKILLQRDLINNTVSLKLELTNKNF